MARSKKDPACMRALEVIQRALADYLTDNHEEPERRMTDNANIAAWLGELVIDGDFVKVTVVVRHEPIFNAS